MIVHITQSKTQVTKLTEGYVHIRNWQEFKHTVTEKKPQLNSVHPRTKRLLKKQRTLHPQNNNAPRQTLLHLLRLPKRRKPPRNKNSPPQRQKRHPKPRRSRSQSLPERSIPKLGSLLVLDNITGDLNV